VGQDAFRVEACVIKVQSNGTYLAELSNGHRLTAFVSEKDKVNFTGLRAGEKAKLQLTPYDLNVGRILVKTKKI